METRIGGSLEFLVERISTRPMIDDLDDLNPQTPDVRDRERSLVGRRDDDRSLAE